MLIKYTGVAIAAERQVEDYRWNPDNNYLQDVTDPKLVLNLLLHTQSQFAISLDDPLLQLVGPQSIERLVLAGIIDVNALTSFKGDELKRVADETEVSVQQLKAWIKEARTNGEEISQEDQQL